MAISRTAPFRSSEAIANGRDDAIHYFTRGFTDDGERTAAADYIDLLIKRHGPVVTGYPSWHPFPYSPKNRLGKRWSFPETCPTQFDGLDHTIYFRDAFLTAPYGGVERVIESALKKECDNCEIDAEEIRDVPLYHPKATPVLVVCKGLPKEDDDTILKRFALGRMLEDELPAWHWAERGETWEDMRRSLLGSPCGSRSSLFVNQNTGKALLEVHEMLNRHGLFGLVPRRSKSRNRD